jgi:hypothetical protein
MQKLDVLTRESLYSSFRSGQHKNLSPIRWSLLCLTLTRIPERTCSLSIPTLRSSKSLEQKTHTSVPRNQKNQIIYWYLGKKKKKKSIRSTMQGTQKGKVDWTDRCRYASRKEEVKSERFILEGIVRSCMCQNSKRRLFLFILIIFIS